MTLRPGKVLIAQAEPRSVRAFVQRSGRKAVGGHICRAYLNSDPHLAVINNTDAVRYILPSVRVVVAVAIDKSSRDGRRDLWWQRTPHPGTVRLTLHTRIQRTTRVTIGGLSVVAARCKEL